MHRMRKKEEKHHMILGIAVAAILLTAILVLLVRIQAATAQSRWRSFFFPAVWEKIQPSPM